MSNSTYICPSCEKKHDSFDVACSCCNADWVECPLSDLPADAEFGGGEGKYGYGTIFSGRWELVLNGTPHTEAARVYPMPALMSKMVMELSSARYEQGAQEAKQRVRQALGITS